MDAAAQAEVWGMLDREALGALAHQGPPVVFATISGAHLYGFASPDSDVDLRGAFLWPAATMLGLRPPQETLSLPGPAHLDLDWVAHDLRKFARLLTQDNGYVLEQLFSPLVVVGGPAHEELKALAQGCITRPTAHHYQGFAKGRRKRLREPGATVKHLLYAHRVLLSGIHLMREGEVQAHLPTLNAHFRLAEVDELIQRKREGAEKMALREGELALHEALLDRLEGALAEAGEASRLPEQAQGVEALEAWVVGLRLSRRLGEAP